MTSFLSPQRPFDAVGAVIEGAARHGERINPGLELARNAEIVHRRTDDDDLGGEEVVERGVGRGDRGLEVDAGRAGAGLGDQQRLRLVRHGLGGEVAVDDAQIRALALEMGDYVGGELAADGFGAGNARVDVKKRHWFDPGFAIDKPARLTRYQTGA